MATVKDYTSLAQAMQDWYSRSDISGFVDYFIQSAEDRIYDDIFTLNMGEGTLDMETSFPVNEAINASGVVPLSDLTGYLALKEMTVSTGGNTFRLQRTNTEFIYSQFPNRQAADVPTYVAREAQTLIFGPYPDSGYSVGGVYWARSNPLSVSNLTTWMTTAIPSVLLAAANAAVALFLKDDKAFATWDAMYQRQLKSYVDRCKAEEYSGSALMVVAA